MTGSSGVARSVAIALLSTVLRVSCTLFLLLICLPALLGAASITSVSPPAGHVGDVVEINGAGFSATPSANVVRFGPNRAAVLAATASQLTVQVPNGEPLGPASVSVNGSSGPIFNVITNAKLSNIPPSPMEACTQTQDSNGTPCVFPIAFLADPIYGQFGEFFQSVVDLRIPGRPGAAPVLQFTIRRQYRSLAVNNGPLGNKWNHNYLENLQLQVDGSIVHDNGMGRYDRYLLNNQGNFVAPPEMFTTLVRNPNGSYTLTYRDRIVKQFNSTGKVQQITDRNGNSLSFAYNAQGQLATVTDTLARPITYTYDPTGKLKQITDFDGRIVSYTYNANGDLASVTSPAVTGTPNGNDFPAGKTTLYTYDSSHRLLTITRPNEAASGGPPFLQNTYDSNGRVVSQFFGGTNASGSPAGGTYFFTYTPLNSGVTSPDPNLPVMRTQQTDRDGNITQYDYNRLGYPVVIREFTRNLRPTDPSVYVTTMTYNADGRLSEIILPAGNPTQYTYDEGNPDRFQQGNMLQQTQLPDAARGGDQSFLTTTYTYEPAFNHILAMAEPRGNDPSYIPQNGGTQSAARYTTTYTYDVKGNLTLKQRPNVILPNGSSQQIITDYTYNQFGQITSDTDPEGNVTQYAYYVMNDPTNTAGGYLKQKTVDATTSPRRTEAAPPGQITTQYFYDPVGNTIRIIDGRGNDTLYTYNQLNQIVELQAEAPFRYITYTYYDANDNVVRRDIENKVATTTDGKPSFTGDGNFATADGTPAFFTNRYTYDILNKLVKDDEDATGSNPSRVITQYQYDANQNRIQETLPSGNIIRYQYDERNLLFTQTKGFGSLGASTTSYSYDLNRDLAQEVDGRGNPTIYKYDGFDRRTATIDAVGGQTTTHYDPAGNPVSTSRFGQPGGPSPTNNSGTGNVLLKAQTSEYDELSRIYQDDDRPVNGTSFVASGVSTSRPPSVTPGPLNPGAISKQYIYDRNSRLVQTIEDDLAVTITQYDGVNRETVVTDPQGNTTVATYDANNNVVQKVETELSQKAGVASEIFTSTYQYDAHNRRTLSSDNCRNTRRKAYDSRNNLTEITDAKADATLGCPASANAQGNSARYAFDGMSRQIQTTEDLRAGGVGAGAIDTSNPFNPTGHIVTGYVYDGNSRLINLVDSNGHTTQYAYDALDRRITEMLADGSKTTYTYDADDNVTTLTDNNGTLQTHTYDAIDRRIQTTVTPAAGVLGTTLNTYQYDGLSRPTKMTDNNDPSDTTSASTVTFAYDSLGRVVEETQNGRAVDSAWFAQAQRTALTYPNSRLLNFTYDSLERIRTIKDNGAATNIASYIYIGPERVLERDYQNSTRLTFLDDAGTVDVGYDGVKRTVMRRDLRSDNSLVVGFTHAYDREYNKSYEEKLHSPANSELYTYDSSYRITDFQRGQLNATKTAIPNPSQTQEWTLDGVGSWRVNTVDDIAENRTVNAVNEYTEISTATLVYDNNGNLISDGVLGYRWDYQNRLRQVCALPTSGMGCTAPGAVLLVTYSYDAMNRRTRKIVVNSGPLNGTTNFYYDGWQVLEERSGSDVLTQQYVYGIYLDEPIALDSAVGPRLFYHQNTLLSTFALTDPSGNVVEGYQYDAYGKQTVFGPGFGPPIGPVSAVGNPFLFTGQRLDSETGLMYYKNRYYSAALGRFISRDLLGYLDNHNLFEYVDDSPTKHTSPNGMGP